MRWNARRMRTSPVGMEDSQRTPVSTEEAPQPPPLLSQGLIVGNMIYCSGQLPIDPKTGVLVQGSIQDRTVSFLTLDYQSDLTQNVRSKPYAILQQY